MVPSEALRGNPTNRAPPQPGHHNRNTRSKTMQQLVTNPLQKALAEVHRGAHNQDLFEIPKQAELDREREAHELAVRPPSPTPPQV